MISQTLRLRMHLENYQKKKIQYNNIYKYYKLVKDDLFKPN